MEKWNIPDSEGNINVPDYLDPLIKTIGNNFGFVIHSDKNMNQAICDIAYKAEQVIKPKWIQCKDQLPEIGVTVLVCLDSQLITCAYRSKKDGINTWELFGDINSVHDVKYQQLIAWQPLPIPFTK